MSAFPVKGKVALVTGGAGGIGFETARQLVQRGARVAVVDLDPKATAEAAAELGRGAVEQYGRALRAELAQHGASASVAYFGFIDTAMTQGVSADSIGARFEATFPTFLMKKLQPSEAGDAIVDGVERRSPRIIAPKRWTGFSVLRGLVNPVLDRRTESDSTTQAIVRDADIPAPTRLEVSR